MEPKQGLAFDSRIESRENSEEWNESDKKGALYGQET